MTTATPEASAKTGNLGLAFAWIGLAMVSFIAMAIGGREATKEVSVLEIMVARSLFLVAVVPLMALASSGGLTQLGTRRVPLHIVRNAVHFCGQCGWFFALSTIPLATVFAIEFTTPIWIALLAPLLLGERMTLGRLIAVLLGFAGVLIVINPGAVTLEAGTLAIIGGAIGYALSNLLTKKLLSTDSPLGVLFVMGVIQVPMSLGLAMAFGTLVWPSTITLIWLLIIAIGGLGAHYGMAKAFQLADLTVIAPMDFFRLPIIALVGVYVYNEPFVPAVVIGGAVIVAANLFGLLAERRRLGAAAR